MYRVNPNPNPNPNPPMLVLGPSIVYLNPRVLCYSFDLGVGSGSHEQALVCLPNRDTVDASRGRTCHCEMATNRVITVVFSTCFGLMYVAISPP